MGARFRASVAGRAGHECGYGARPRLETNCSHDGFDDHALSNAEVADVALGNAEVADDALSNANTNKTLTAPETLKYNLRNTWQDFSSL